jgi:branched-chain amino acid transport system substrate-binding protein
MTKNLRAGVARRRLMQAAGGLGMSALGLPAILTSRARAAEEFRIGWVRPSTGVVASSFAPNFVGGLVAVDEINEMGGILGRKIVRVEVDDEGSPAKEPAVARKLQQDGIDIFIGPTGSSQALASLAYTSSAHILQTTYAAVVPVGDGKKYPFHYQFVVNTDMEAAFGCHAMVEQMKIRKIGILQENSAYGEMLTGAAQQTLKAMGIEPVGVEVYPLTATQLDGYVGNLRKAGAEGVMIWAATVPPCAMAFNAMHNQKWYPPVIGHLTLLNSTLFNLAPLDQFGDQLYGISYKTLSWEGNSQPGAKQVAFAKRMTNYPEAKGNETPAACGPYYDFLFALKQVIESEKTFDVARLKVALDNLKDFDGLLGRSSFTPDNHCGLTIDSLAAVKMKSYKDARAMGVFRERM